MEGPAADSLGGISLGVRKPNVALQEILSRKRSTAVTSKRLLFGIWALMSVGLNSDKHLQELTCSQVTIEMLRTPEGSTTLVASMALGWEALLGNSIAEGVSSRPSGVQ